MMHDIISTSDNNEYVLGSPTEAGDNIFISYN